MAGKYKSKLITLFQQDTSFRPCYTWTQNQLERKEIIIVGNNFKLRKLLLKELHASSMGGHSGLEATKKRISSHFY